MGEKSPFETLSCEESVKKLNVDPSVGLNDDEVQKRQSQYGLNALAEKKTHPLLKFLSYFWGPIPWMIEIAAILSGALHRWPDFILITALLFINGGIGFFQEHKADNAIQALKQSLALKARVLRNRKWSEIDAKELVPGDIISIKLGGILPADVKLLSGAYLSVDQSALTGESLPVSKKVGEMAYSGTIAKLGEMDAVVTETGEKTFFGKTARLVSEAKPKSHFQEAVLKVEHFLIISTLAIASILLIVDIFRMHDEGKKLADIFIFILVLVIAGIPVALPAVLSTTLAIGAHHLAKLKAIVSKIIVIEELAGMDILCSDKTGTLTKNELTIRDVIPLDCSKEDLLLYAALASSEESGDVIDELFFDAAKNDRRLAQYKTTQFLPFDPVHKKTEAVVKNGGKEIHVSKGAPQVILKDSSLSEEVQKKIQAQIEENAQQGYRTLGVAKEKQFLGLIALYDPPREDTKETIATIYDMGASVKMVTGDHEAIARVIAGDVGLKTNILPVKETSDFEHADGFAEVYPEDKFQIVQKLQEKKHIVGMTGDGVNDAPALKQADVGIAVSNATDAARAAADLVLTKPGLMVITRAIEEARHIFERMKSYVIYRISETCRLLLFLFLAILIFKSYPLTAIMVVLIALLNDIPIMMIAYDNMSIQKRPYAWNIKEVLFIAVGLAFAGVVSTFGLYWIAKFVWNLPEIKCKTLAFMAFLCGGNLTIYLTRNRGAFWDRPLPEWKFFCATLFSQLVGTFVSAYGLGTTDFVGVGWKYVGLSWIYLAVWFCIFSLTKAGLYHMLESREKHYKEKMNQRLHPHAS